MKDLANAPTMAATTAPEISDPALDDDRVTGLTYKMEFCVRSMNRRMDEADAVLKRIGDNLQRMEHETRTSRPAPRKNGGTD